MTKEEKYQKALDELYKKHQRRIEARGAIDMIAGHNFIGYIGFSDDKWWCDVWSYSVNHGKIFGNSQEEIEKIAYERYDCAN